MYGSVAPSVCDSASGSTLIQMSGVVSTLPDAVRRKYAVLMIPGTLRNLGSSVTVTVFPETLALWSA